MIAPFERLIAGRYLRARKGERFVSIIAIFSLIGIALGVATLIVVASVMSGFQDAIVSRFLGVSGHITIEAFAGARIENFPPLVKQSLAIPGVTSATAVLDGQVLLSNPKGSNVGGLARGIAQADLRALPQIGDHIVAGSLNDFAGDNAIAIGTGLARSQRLAIGAELTLLSPQGAVTAFGNIPRVRAYRIVAIFDSGLAQYNNSVVFLPLPAAQVFFQAPNAVSSIELRLADPQNLAPVIAALPTLTAGRQVQVRDWRHANDQLISVLQIQKDTMFIVLGMIILVAAFNVISSLIMLVKDKRRDIAVLRTMGASSSAILRIFILCGAFVGITGTALGTLLGVLVCRNIVAIQTAIESATGGKVFDSSVFMLSALPNTVDWPSVARTVALGLALSLLATIYPAWRAAGTDPVEVLRNE